MHRSADDTLALIPRPQPVTTALPAPVLAPEKSPRRLILWPWILLAITAFGTWLRFYNLTYPALWNDETLVFWRVCGSYGQMLRPLSTDGFPPLHYSFYWLLGNLDKASWMPWTWPAVFMLVGIACTTLAVLYRGMIGPKWTRIVGWSFAGIGALAALRQFTQPLPLVHWLWIGRIVHSVKLTPFVMRAPVAACGALTIPAIYFLARQMVDRRTSMIAALFTACSAFMLFYSRDAKMYADLWLFESLHIGCLLWWFRQGGSTRWLCWVASGVAMAGVHASSYAVLAISVVIFLTFLVTKAKMKPLTGILFALGILIVISGPLGYVLKFNKWVDRVEEDGSKSGIGWNAWYNGDRTGPELAVYGTSAFLNGWEWPRDDYVDRLNPYDPDESIYEPKNSKPAEVHRGEPIREPLLEGPQTAFLVCSVLLFIGLIPWPRKWRPPETPLDPPGETRWRTLLWLGLWIVGLGYGFYCHSVTNFVSPWEWLKWLAHPPLELAIVLRLIVAGWIVAACLKPSWQSVGRFAATTAVLALIFAALYGLYLLCKDLSTAAEEDGNPWRPVWLPRYLGIIWPAFGIAVAALLMRLPTRPFRTAAVAFLMLVNLGVFGMRMTLGTEPPIDKLADDEWRSQDPKSGVRCYDGVEFRSHGGDIAVAGTTMAPGYGPDGIAVDGGRYYMQNLADRKPMSPVLFNLSLGNQIKPENRFNLREFMTPDEIKADLAASPQVKTFILWTRIGPYENPTRAPFCRINIEEKSYNGPYDISPKQWRQTKEETFVVRIPWEWRERCTWIRREYTRVEELPKPH